MRKRLHRRYDAPLKTLRGFLQIKDDKIRLQAALRMTEIYLEFDRAQERAAVAVARAEARRAEAETPVSSTPEIAPVARTAEQAAEEFLAGLKVKAVSNAE